MSDRLKRLRRAFEGLSLRERVLVLVTALAALTLPIIFYLAEPAYQEARRLEGELRQLETRAAQARLDEATLEADLRKDPDQALKDRIQRLQARLATVNDTLKTRTAGLVSPGRMLDLLEETLSRQQALQLESLEKLPAQPLALEGEKEAPAVYRHELKLVFRGNFFAVRDYLRTLEALPRPFFWNALNYQVLDYPEARVALQVYTLSTAPGWLGI